MYEIVKKMFFNNENIFMIYDINYKVYKIFYYKINYDIIIRDRYNFL
jgi:hypothetical protein